jgi:hypothetical protein
MLRPEFLPLKRSSAVEDRTAHSVATELDQRVNTNK